MSLRTLINRVAPHRTESTTTDKDNPPEREPFDPAIIPLMLVEAYTRIHDKPELKGSTRLIKLTFLFEQERLTNSSYATPDIPTYNYYGAEYGPFSDYLAHDLHNWRDKILQIRTEENRSDQTINYLRLTADGEKIIDQMFEFSPYERTELQPVLDDFIRSHGNIPISRLLEYTYERYPDYTDNSII